MFRQVVWKLTLSLIIVFWALLSLFPLQDRPFPSYVRGEVTAQTAEFARLMERASARVRDGQAPSVFVALKQIGREERIDLSKFFPQINLEKSLRNLEKRNDILLDELLKRSKGRLQLGLDLKGGVAFTLETSVPVDDLHPEERREKLSKAIEIIGDRVNGLGVAEPVIRPVGENRIEVQLPGVSTKDKPEVVNALRKPARLDFRLVHPELARLPEPPPADVVPPGFEIMAMDEEDRNTGRAFQLFYAVKRIPEMTGETVTQAFPSMDLYGRYEIRLAFNSEGAKRFADVTEANTGRLLGIVLDGRLFSAPRINEPITGGSAQITGSFTAREALELSNVLNNPLDLPLEVKEQFEVGPSLAQDAVDSAVKAFVIASALTVAFIVLFYRVGGVLAVLAMGVNVLVLLGVMANIGATLTLPGIAGIVLTLAMSVDSNILIFERMREELAQGKSLKAALEAGFEKAFSAILDANVTTLITAGIMIWLGTGPVKGFGVTLSIGIFTTMFAALVVSRLFLQLVIDSELIRRMPMLSILQNTRYDFMGHARPAFIGSWVVVLIGIGTVIYKGDSIYGIDFTGGDSVTLSFKERVEVGELRRVVTAAGVAEFAPSYQKQLGSDLEVLRFQVPFDEGARAVAALQQAFPAAGFIVVGENRIGPSIGEEIQWNAFLAISLSLVGILLYVAFRFEIGYGVGAVVCTIHDLLMTVGIFVLFDRQFNASMVAAILLIAGYSINDTIVVFDRIREELKLNPTGTLRDIINRSLNLTLSRTIITGGTTLFSAITLVAVTGGDVNDIAFTLLIGVIVGTFSSLYIASPVFFWWHKGDRRHVEEHKDLAPKYEWVGASKASR